METLRAGTQGVDVAPSGQRNVLELIDKDVEAVFDGIVARIDAEQLPS